MKKSMITSVVLLVVGFLMFTVINNSLFSGVRVDLTENRLFTLSEGTREILEDIDEPINLYLFFSDKVSEDLTSLRAYAQRVEEMLREYQLLAGANIRLSVIDPEPFSEDEDRAAAFGLQSVPVNQAGDELYFGLAGTNAIDGEAVLPFFQPEREAFLEYEITKLVYTLSETEKPRVGLFSGLPITGQVDPGTFQQSPGWVFADQLGELFDVNTLDLITAASLADIDLLVLVHPTGIDEDALYAIDQHVMAGGKLIAFIDPLAEMAQPATPGSPVASPASASDLNRLTTAWGVTLREGKVLADPDIALLVGGADGRPVRHLGILGFTQAQLAVDDVVTAPLEVINMSTVGILDVDPPDGIQADSLIVSSDRAGTLDALQFQFLVNPEDLQTGFLPADEAFVVATRLSGNARSAFSETHAGTDGHRAATDALQVVIVADSDVLSDRLWVEVQSFFGQQIASAFADNGSLITNMVENLSGSSALIQVRSRGQFVRPFERVERLRREAEASYLQSAEDLQAQLAETDRQLSELESARLDDGLLTLSPDQEAALNRFQDEKLRIRKQLRDVRHQLDKDIETLGSRLKLINILIMPLLLTGLLLVIRYLGLARREELN